MLGQPDDGRTFLERIEMPASPPAFMPADFLDYLVSRYALHGFGPPHNWYRNFQRTFERTAAFEDDVIRVPAMYLTGDEEWTVELAPTLGLDPLAKFSDLRITDMTEGGHWLGQERPDWVNEKIGEFFGAIGY
jgi:pimeloyl-ACP methyl ester carboxylesterase